MYTCMEDEDDDDDGEKQYRMKNDDDDDDDERKVNNKRKKNTDSWTGVKEVFLIFMSRCILYVAKFVCFRLFFLKIMFLQCIFFVSSWFRRYEAF